MTMTEALVALSEAIDGHPVHLAPMTLTRIATVKRDQAAAAGDRDAYDAYSFALGEINRADAALSVPARVQAREVSEAKAAECWAGAAERLRSLKAPGVTL
jgi:hypothetical protein